MGFLHPRLHLAFSVILLAIEVSGTSVSRTSDAAQDEQHSLFAIQAYLPNTHRPGQQDRQRCNRQQRVHELVTTLNRQE